VKAIKSRALSYGLLAAITVYTFGYTLFYSNIFAGFDGFMQRSGRWINESIPKGAAVNTSFYPHFSIGGYPPFSLLDFRVNETETSDYIIEVKYKSSASIDYFVPKNYSLIKRMEMDKGMLSKIYSRQALAFLDPEILVYKIVN
jgi:hypothetical protein